MMTDLKGADARGISSRESGKSICKGPGGGREHCMSITKDAAAAGCRMQLELSS